MSRPIAYRPIYNLKSDRIDLGVQTYAYTLSRYTSQMLIGKESSIYFDTNQVQVNGNA